MSSFRGSPFTASLCRKIGTTGKAVRHLPASPLLLAAAFDGTSGRILPVMWLSFCATARHRKRTASSCRHYDRGRERRRGGVSHVSPFDGRSCSTSLFPMLRSISGRSAAANKGAAARESAGESSQATRSQSSYLLHAQDGTFSSFHSLAEFKWPFFPYSLYSDCFPPNPRSRIPM